MIKVGNKFRWDHFSRHFLGQHPSLASPLSTFLRLPLLLLLLLTPFSVCRRIPFYTLRCFLAFELIQILRVAFPSSLSLVLSIALSLSHTHTHTHTHPPTHTHTHHYTHTHTPRRSLFQAAKVHYYFLQDSLFWTKEGKIKMLLESSQYVSLEENIVLNLNLASDIGNCLWWSYVHRCTKRLSWVKPRWYLLG